MIFISNTEIIMTKKWYIHNRQLVLFDKVIPLSYRFIGWQTVEELKNQLDAHPHYIQIG